MGCLESKSDCCCGDNRKENDCNGCDNVLPLESLWAAGMDDGMGLEQLYNNTTTSNSKRKHQQQSSLQRNEKEQEQNEIASLPSTGLCGFPSPPPPVPRRYISSLRVRNRRTGTDSFKTTTNTTCCDSQTRFTRCLRAFYRDLAVCDTATSSWAPNLPPAALCPAYFCPDLVLNAAADAYEPIELGHLLSSITTKSGIILEPARKILVEGIPGNGCTALALRLLHSWATQNNWSSAASTISVALFVPLRELRGRTICQYLCKELLPRSAAADLPQLWRHRFAALQDRLLFVLDGYEEDDHHLSDDINELLYRNRLFPECRIVVITSCQEFGDQLAPFVQRKVRFLGRDWSQVERFVQVYFGDSRAKQLLKIICDNKEVLKPVAQAPLGWLCLCLLYKDDYFPKDMLHVYESLTQYLVYGGWIRRPILSTERTLTQFGKFVLSSMKSTRNPYTFSENQVKRVRQHTFFSNLALLNPNTTFGRSPRGDHVYTFVHPIFAEYLAARYVMHETARGGSAALQRQLEALPGIGHSSSSTQLILRFLMAMLGAQGHLVLDLLCPMDLSTELVLMLLKEAGAHRSNVTTVCRLLEGSEWPRVQTTPAELEGWTYILLSGHCTLDRLEIQVYQLGNLESAYLEMFFKALSFNDSIRMVKMCSILDQWIHDVQELAVNVSTVLHKTRLTCFELIITSSSLQEEEDAPERFQFIVDQICAPLVSRSIRLERLALDFTLSSTQVQQLCGAIESGRGVCSLHLPHLCMDIETVTSVARLLLRSPLTALNIAGSWSVPVIYHHDDVPSSSGVSSMASGSNKVSPNSPFSSLPPRNNQYFTARPRNFHFASCTTSSHQHGFHKIFDAVSNSLVLDHLNISRCIFAGAEDAACLAESIKRSQTLRSLRMQGFTRFTEILTVILALAENVSLQLLDLASTRITLEDSQIQFVCKSLARNTTLRTLNLDGWRYRLEEEEEEAVTLKQIISFLASTRLVELILDNGRIHYFVSDQMLNTEPIIFGSETLRHLRLAGVEITLNGHPVVPALHGPTLLPYLIGFTSLVHLDLSMDRTQSNTVVDDAVLLNFFSHLSHHFQSLKMLIINNWSICMGNNSYGKTLQTIRRLLLLDTCTLTVLKMHSLTVATTTTKRRIEHLFLRSILFGLHALNNLDVSGVNLSKFQAKHLAKTLRTNVERSLDLNVDGLSSESARTLVAHLEKNNSKLQVSYIGGLSCFIRIHSIATD